MQEVGGRSAIVVPIRLPPALEALRRRHVSNAGLGVPAHVTLLFPFVPAGSIDPTVVARAGSVLAQFAPFDVELREVRVWEPAGDDPGIAWLAPEPAAPFKEMTEALAAAFPDHPPYGGAHAEVIPHLTLAEAPDGLAGISEAARLALAASPALTARPSRTRAPASRAPAPHVHPIRRRVASAALLVERRDGRWRVARRLPLG